MEHVFVYMFDLQDRVTGLWARSRRLATLAAIARLGARVVRDSGRQVFAESVGQDGLVAESYTK